MARTQFGQTVKVIRLDNALELNKSYKILELFANLGLATKLVVHNHHTKCCGGKETQALIGGLQGPAISGIITLEILG